MTQSITASAPGKIHFLGEHTAVYGKPAILAAIDKRCTIELTPSQTDEVVISAKNLHKTVKLTYPQVLQIRDEAQEQWEEYQKTGNLSILRGVVKNDLMYPIIAIGETLRYFKKTTADGFQMTIDSDIPVGSGHGSSAAVAASVVAAIAAFLYKDLSFPRKRESSEKTNSLLTGSRIKSWMTSLDVISTIAIRVEQKRHGNPSYGDVGAVVNGGLIWFQKKSPEDIVIKPLQLTVPKKIEKNLIVIQSGMPDESTGEMVHYVAEYCKSQPEMFEKICNEQEKLTNELVDVLKNGDEEKFLRILTKGEKNLETIGAVSSSAQQLIRAIEKAGGAAKICGAGGKTNGSGIILAYHKDNKILEKLIKRTSLQYYSTQLGGEGLKIE